MELLISAAALVVGITLGFLIGFYRSRAQLTVLEERTSNLQAQLEKKESEFGQQIKLKDEEINRNKEEYKEEAERVGHAQNAELTRERTRSSELDRQLASLRSEYANLEERLKEQKSELAGMQEEVRNQFEVLANKILDEKSEKFTKQNREQLDQLLNPLGNKLEEFKKKVEETYEKGTQERSSLKAEIKHMMDLNQKMTDEAKNLTKALKGDSKTQGDWGEMILERILEKSGLEKGREYETQVSETVDGRQLRPDVVIHLPDQKYLIVDSKVSLKAFEAYTSAEDEGLAAQALKQHVQSVKNHVRGLSDKNYAQLFENKSPDFVLLFIPVEPAFAAALKAEPDLYGEAFERNIVMVSPSTLLATLSTINTIWKREYQNRNALEIAKQGGALYDKFVGFLETMDSVGQRIRQTQESYDKAVNQLSTGTGNLVRRAERLKELGAKTTKQLPENLINE
ncbi:MAG: DNA recombination protein RmuC [Bacteroidota bacterium]